jgi:signal peptidase II
MLRKLTVIVAILTVCVACDQATKFVAKRYLTQYETVSLFGDGIRLQLAKNYGTFLSLGSSMPAGLRNAATTIGVGALLIVLLGYAVMTKTENLIATVAIAMLIGGGLSNLLDRVAYGGYVLDFLNLGIGPLRTGIFNVADMFIMLGVFLMLFSERLQRRLSQRRTAD